MYKTKSKGGVGVKWKDGQFVQRARGTKNKGSGRPMQALVVHIKKFLSLSQEPSVLRAIETLQGCGWILSDICVNELQLWTTGTQQGQLSLFSLRSSREITQKVRFLTLLTLIGLFKISSSEPYKSTLFSPLHTLI